MIADEIGDNFLLAYIQPDQRVRFQNVITMFVVVERIDEMPDIVQECADLKQQVFLFIKAMQFL